MLFSGMLQLDPLHHTHSDPHLPRNLANPLVLFSKGLSDCLLDFRPIVGRCQANHPHAPWVKRRGKGKAFGVNIPQEPLVRAGVKPGSRFAVKASNGKVVLTNQ